MTVIQGPLTGITIVDLTRILSGPYATMLLSELGARVIKVEEPGKGDDARAYGPFIQGRPCYFNSINRNKESIALDLRKEEDRSIFDSLLANADVLTENFRPGVMEKLGYDWDQIHTRFPKIIFASVSGYGQTGPESRKPGYDMVLQGVTGMMSITGEADGEPCRTGISIADVGTGLFTAVAISSALLHRERTGESTRIDLAMFDCMLSIMETPISRYLMTGEIATRMGSFHPAIMPFEAFATQDSHITLACGNDKIFKQFCAAIHREDLAKNPDFASNLSRVENRNALRTEIGKELAGATTAQWTSRLEMLGIPVGPINNVAQAVDHPQVAARNMLVETLDPLLGPLRVVGSPFKMSAFSDSTTRKLAPELDEDRDRLIAEFHRPST
jgi:CoA:oxalate CoA-transferase